MRVRVSVALNICLVCLSVPGFVRAWLFVCSCLCWRVVCVRVYVCVCDSVCVHVLACACACVHVVRFVCERESETTSVMGDGVPGSACRLCHGGLVSDAIL